MSHRNNAPHAMLLCVVSADELAAVKNIAGNQIFWISKFYLSADLILSESFHAMSFNVCVGGLHMYAATPQCTTDYDVMCNVSR